MLTNVLLALDDYVWDLALQSWSTYVLIEAIKRNNI
jgi:hypothetical protein